MPASVGVSVSRNPEADPETLLREADVAMYRAKGSGGRRPELFDENLRREITAHLEIEERLLNALPRQELVLTYQPILPLAGGRAVGCEALVRWHPDGAAEGTIDELLPSTFLPRAGDSELIVQIGDWVLHTACAQAAAWFRAGTAIPMLSKRLGFDPALTAGPFETAFQDVLGVTIFLSLATALLHWLV